MTNEQARELQKGDRIASKDDVPAYKPRRISREPWIGASGEVRVSCHSYDKGAWISPINFVRVPASAPHYDEKLGVWMRLTNKKKDGNTSDIYVAMKVAP